MKEQQLARALGWFSIGLGLAELLAPKKVGEAAGLSDHTTMLRVFGARELAAGVALLTQEDTGPWMWARVAGDALDLAALGAAYASENSDRTRLTIATAAVAGVTALDVLCAQQITRKHHTPDAKPRKQPPGHFKRVVTINRPAAELYSFWRRFENLPRIMEHLVSVQSNADGKRSRWVAKAPGGKTVEWDAEIVNERPNEVIAWRSLPGSDVHNAGSIRFDTCPNARGTFVKLEMQYSPPGGRIGAGIAKLLGHAPEQQVANDLRRFKQFMETGEIPTTVGQAAGRPESTSRRYDKVAKSWAAA